MNEFINIDVSSGLVALKPVGKTQFAPSHTLRLSCSIVRHIWSLANQHPELRFGRAARALQQRSVRILSILCQSTGYEARVATRGTPTRSWEGVFFSLFAR